MAECFRLNQVSKTPSITSRLACAAAAVLCLLSPSNAGKTHWAFEAPEQPRVPESATGSSTGVIDSFVEAKLRDNGLGFSPLAEKHTLIRRLSFDLRGLPPTAGEAATFVEDDSPDAWQKLVERFLASPHFGETMAQQWLDLARYGDTSGYAADRTRTIWPYRDWVVRAINENLPFDQFVVEQLAGDMLPNATPEQRLATGFHRNAMQAKGNNPRKEEFRVKGIVDRLTTTGRALLGLSIECAECHDHKYDPISQREYYELFAIFNNVPHLGEGYGVHGPRMNYLPEEFRAKRKHLEAQVAKLPPPEPWPVNTERDWLGRWDGAAVETDATQFSVTGDFTITATIRTKAKTANVVSKYDWRAKQRSYVFGIGGEGDKNGVPGHLFAWVSAKTDPFEGIEIHGSQAVNDGEEHRVAVIFSAGKSIALVVDGIEDTEATVIGKVPPSVAVSNRPLAIGAGYNDAAHPSAFVFDGTLGDVRLYDRALELPVESPERARLSKIIKEIDANALTVPVMVEQAEARGTFVHGRGNFKDRGARVHPGVPKFLPPLARGEPANRLTFARWLTDGQHPLTARVAVNYLWQHFFGTGLVATAGDFGTQGAAPSHPGLLDWLALEYIRSGWDRKHMIRLIVNSRTYRQSSCALESDVDPSILASMPRGRHAAERIRDSALAASRLISTTIGGPPVFPVQPDGYYEERGQNTEGNSNFTWKASPGEGRYRRTLYMYWKRMALHPSLAALDAPPRQVCEVRRSITNTPQQALVTLNDPMFHECAVALGKVIEGTAVSAHDRIEFAFQSCLSRSPDADELARFSQFVSRSPDPWTSIAAVLLNLDEFLTRE